MRRLREARGEAFETLGRKVDLVDFTHNDYDFEYVHLEALLRLQGQYGATRCGWTRVGEAAERQLREGYETTKKALRVASRLEEKLPSSQNKALRLSILEDALLVITNVKIPNNPFCDELTSMIPGLLLKESAIRAALEGEVESSEDLGDIWNVISDWIIVVALEGMMPAAEQTFSRAGLVP